MRAVGSGPHANPATRPRTTRPADGSPCASGVDRRRAGGSRGARRGPGVEASVTAPTTARAGPLERGAARRDGRARGQDVVDEQDVPPRQRADVPRRHPHVAGEVARARPGRRGRPGRARATRTSTRRASARRHPPRTSPSATPRGERVDEVAAPASTRRGRRRAGDDEQRPGTETGAQRPPAASASAAANGRVEVEPAAVLPGDDRAPDVARCSPRASTPAAARARPSGRAAAHGPRTATADPRGARAHDGHHATSSRTAARALDREERGRAAHARTSCARACAARRSRRPSARVDGRWAVDGSSAGERRVRRARHAQDLRPGRADEPAQLAVGRRDVDDRARRRGRPGSPPRAAPWSARRPGPGAPPGCRRTARRPRASTPRPRPPTSRRPATRPHGPATRAAAGRPTRRA